MHPVEDEERVRRREMRRKWHEEASGFKPTKVLAYKRNGRQEQKAMVWQPEGRMAGERRPGILFLHGGRWSRQAPDGITRICDWYALHGLVAVAVELSPAQAQTAPLLQGITDARDAFEWLWAHADTLGIDTARLYAAGSSSGGHLAASLGTIRSRLPDTVTVSGYHYPVALVLFNPALLLDSTLLAKAGITLNEVLAERYSPYHHVREDHPPTLIMHGTADTDIPIDYSRRYATRLRELGVPCTLTEVPDARHGFFKEPEHFDASMEASLRFLMGQRR